MFEIWEVIWVGYSTQAVKRALDNAMAGHADEEDKKALAYMANPNGSRLERDCAYWLDKANNQ